MSINSIEDVHRFLDAIPTFRAEGKKAADFSLRRFDKFCTAMDNPQNNFAAIHVAGSNGKGSTCHILGSIYHHAGYKTGVYTSPHIVFYSERFSINGEQISDKALVRFFKQHESLIKTFRLTYFEISTAVAFWWFARQQVDIAVIEVGLGGRLDATNVITPLISVITSIAMDHTDILGETLAEIAREKAGIIKPGVPVVLGNVRETARRQIVQVAKERGSSVIRIDELDPHCKNGRYSIYIGEKQIELESSLETPVQAFNIAVSWRVVQALKHRFPVSEQQFREGVKMVGAVFPNRGRFEKLHPEYDWYFDGAHNLEAVQAMKQAVKALQPVSETVLVLALMNDKINKKMVIEFLEFKKISYHTLPLGRAATLEDIQPWLPNARPFPDKQISPNTFLKELSSELVIFAGSFYFYATVLNWVSNFTNR